MSAVASSPKGGSKKAREAPSSGGGGRGKKTIQRRPGKKWTPEDDKFLMELVEKHGTHRWSQVGVLCGRNGKQCRERWHNQLDPAIKKDVAAAAASNR